MMVERTCEEVRSMVRGLHYSDEEEKIHWEPFEDYDNEWVEEQVENTTRYWCDFFGIKYTEEGGE